MGFDSIFRCIGNRRSTGRERHPSVFLRALCFGFENACRAEHIGIDKRSRFFPAAGNFLFWDQVPQPSASGAGCLDMYGLWDWPFQSILASVSRKVKVENAMFNMTPNILRNFFSKRATRRYPLEVRKSFENNRGELVNEIDKCTFCGICVLKFPSRYIKVDKKTAAWRCAPFSCVYCGVCVDACKAKSLRLNNRYRPPTLHRDVLE